MPKQDIAILGYNIPEFEKQTTIVLERMNSVIAAIEKIDNSIINLGNFGAGVKDFKQAADQLSQSTSNLDKQTSAYNKTLLEQARIRETNAKAAKAEVAADNEVIKQIGLEADAERKLAQAKTATAKASKQKADAAATENMPFSTNVTPDGSINEPTVGNTSGSVVSDQELANTQAQLEAQAALNAEKKESAQIDTQTSIATAQFTSALEAEVAVLIENENALAANKAAQKTLLADISANGIATEKQTADLVALKTEQYALNESISTTRGNVKNLTKEFIADEGSIIELRAQVNRLTTQYEALSAAEKKSQFGVNLKTQLNTLQPALQKAEGEIGKFQRNVGNYSGDITKAFGGAFSYLRQIAYIVPGIGMAGIIGGISEGIITLIKNLDAGVDHLHVVDQVIQGTDESSDALRTSLRDLGDTADDIADGAFKKLSEATQKLQDDLGETPDAVEIAQGALVLLEDQLDKLNKKLEAVSSTQATGMMGVSTSVTALQGQIQGQIDETNKKIDDGNKKLNDNRVARQREALIGQGQVNEQFLKDNLQLEIDANNKIISDDLKSFTVRKSALSSNLDDMLDINRINRDKELQDAKDDETKKNLALEKFRYENLKAQADYNQRLLDLNKKASEKSFKDYTDSLKAQIEALQHIINNDDLSSYATFQKRYEASAKINQLETNLSDATLQHDIQTGKSRVTAAEEAGNRLIDIATKTYQNIQKINISKNLFPEPDIIPPVDVQRQAQPIIDSFKFINDAILKNLNDTSKESANLFTIAFEQEKFQLAEKYNQGLISREEYEKGLADLTKKYSKDSLQYAIDEAEKRLALLDKESDAYKTLAKAIADAKSTLGKDSGLKELAYDLQNIADITANVTEAFTALANIQFDNQKAQLEEIGAQEEKNYEQEQQNIQNSTANDQERADQLKILDSQHAARQEEIARKQREIDNKKAEFDKAAAILNITLNTAAAVVKALAVGGPFALPLAISIGALGAAQLAAAIATKVPHYEHGTKSAKEGWALTDEKGPELYQEPSGNWFFGNDKPTYRYLKAGTQIVSHDEVNKLLYTAMLRNTGRQLSMAKETKQEFDYDKLGSVISKNMKNQKRPFVRVINNIGEDLRNLDYIRRHMC